MESSELEIGQMPAGTITATFEKSNVDDTRGLDVDDSSSSSERAYVEDSPENAAHAEGNAQTVNNNQSKESGADEVKSEPVFFGVSFPSLKSMAEAGIGEVKRTDQGSSQSDKKDTSEHKRLSLSEGNSPSSVTQAGDDEESGIDMPQRSVTSPTSESETTDQRGGDEITNQPSVGTSTTPTKRKQSAKEIIEEIEMALLKNVSECSTSAIKPRKVSPERRNEVDDSQPPASGCLGAEVKQQTASEVISAIAVKRKEKVENFAAAQIEKEKMSSSTPCLFTSGTGTEPEPMFPVIQKATSSPVLPVIKITVINDDNEEEILVQEDLEPMEGKEESSATTSQETSNVPVEAEQTLLDKEPALVEQTLLDKDRTAQISNQDIASSKNKSSDGATEVKVPKPHFILSESASSARNEFRTPRSSFSTKTREEGPSFGSKTLHVGIFICAAIISSIGLGLYMLAHDGKVPNFFKDIGLSLSLISGVLGTYSVIYITFLLCYPRILKFLHPPSYQMIRYTETVTSMNTFTRPGNFDVESQYQDCERTYGTSTRTPRQEDSTGDRPNSWSVMSNTTQKPDTEVTKLQKTFSDAMAQQIGESPSEGQPESSEIGESSSNESASSKTASANASAEIAPDSAGPETVESIIVTLKKD